MAKGRKPAAKSKVVEEDDEVDEVNALSGFPEDGEEFHEANEPPDAQDDDEDENDETPPQKDPAIAALEARLEASERLVQQLTRQVTPPTVKEPVAEDDPIDAVDWEQEIFQDPKAAVKKIIEAAEKRAEKKLTTKYDRVEGQKKFWNDFYAKHKDLKEDHDLVEVILQSNFNALANIPVDDAISKLADLTRTRLLRYSGNKPKGKKVRVEGAQPPSAPKAPVEEDRPTTLSDIIRRRVQQRSKASAV